MTEPHRNPVSLNLSPRRVVLLLGDLVMFLGFALIGRSSHAMQNDALGVLGTAFPFVAGWLLVALLTRAYSERATATPARAVGYALLTWGLALPVGLVIRAMILGRPSQSTFILVVAGFMLVALVGWRFLYSLIVAR